MPTFCTSPNRPGGIRPTDFATGSTLFIDGGCVGNVPPMLSAAKTGRTDIVAMLAAAAAFDAEVGQAREAFGPCVAYEDGGYSMCYSGSRLILDHLESEFVL